MVKNIKLRKAFALVALFATALTSFPMVNNKVEAAIPALSVTALSSTTVKEGGSVSFTLKYHGDIKMITLNEKSIGLDGFTATKKITVSGNDRIVTLSNIKSTNDVYTGKYVHIAGGTAISSDLQMVRELNTQVFTIVPKDTKAPVLTISKPNPSKVNVGGTVTYTLKYTDNVGIKMITLNEKSLGLEGFTATKKVVINKDNTATVTLSNIQGEVGGNKVLYVAGGTAIDADLNMANKVTAEAFTIEKKVSKAPVLTISKPNPEKVYNGGTVTYTLTYTDDVKVKMITLNEKSLGLKGFTADKKVVINKDNTATVTLSNIKGEIGGDKILYVAGGTAIDEDLNMANEVTATAFTIEAEPVKPEPQKPEPVKPEPVKPQPQKPADWKDNPNTGI